MKVEHEVELQENHAIAKMTAQCAQYMTALKIVCKRKNQPTIVQESPHYNLIGGEIIFEVFHSM